MLDRCNKTALLFGCLACLVVTSVVNADGRVFVLDLRNSSGLQGFRDAEGACASQQAHLASAEELHHAVVECFFSPCTRGWLYGGTVGTTVCNVVGSALKAVDVRTENTIEDTAHLDAFCIKDKGVPCGDPPSFPNARLQGHTGYDMGDELLYTCVTGYAMPSGHSAFSLLCDSCGEWYGLVEICVKDETESPVDYEDKFTDSYVEAERLNERPQEAHQEVYEEVQRAAYPEEGRSQEQQETSFSVELEKEHEDQHGEQGVEGEVIIRPFEGAEGGGEKDEDRAVEDFIGHPRWEQERRVVVKNDAATEAPVSLLSQKHLFWFPSEAFQEEGHPVSTNPVTQTTQRASGAQSEESKEHDSQETHHHQSTVDVDDRDDERGGYADPDTDDRDDHHESNHEELDAHDDSLHDDLDDHASRHDKDDDHVKHYIPAQHEDLDRPDQYEEHDDHDDHYDMGEHEEGHNRVRSQEYEDTYGEHESYEEHDDVTGDRGDDDRIHPDGSEEHPDSDDHHDHDDHEHDDHADHDHDDHEHHDHVDHEHHDHEHHDHEHHDHDSHEDDNDGHQHVIFSTAADEHQNGTQKGAEGGVATDDTWLDGYPVVPEETEIADSTTESVRPEDTDRGAVVRATDKPNEVEIRGPGPHTTLAEVGGSPTTMPALNQGGAEELWPGFIPNAAPSQPSDSPSYSDTLDYDTQQAAPTHFWQGDLTEHPLLDHSPVPPMHDGNDVVMEEHTVYILPGETGERGEMEGEIGEAICTGDNCPLHPPSSSSRGPTVAAIIVALCAIATAVIVGVWCYRRQQQKNSVYEMNGKGQSQTRQGQQIEMQQKV
ncbi:sushi domain-containing protein 5 [Cyclopterus lumpus]|uniref:sushi domain-containing protein 5 n=1 Tax=Cyclopterus lumpus TaxID=8103 RepID=UPI0014861002|nr:sushi domain-containing protein 5 [Cyclopterus lumpus]